MEYASETETNTHTSCKYKAIYVLLSFFIPLVVCLLSLIALHVIPFGEHNLTITDARYYLNGEMFISRLLKGQENIFYSFNNGLGGNEWGTFAWGGFSIGNLLSYFATLETIPAVFTWICVINLAICGLTMYCLLAYVNGHKVSNLIFSTSYALIGFNVVNCYQVGFALGPETLPLVLLGLLLLFRGKTPIVYIFSIAFCSFFDFYFAFHLCVISLIYFAGYLYVHNELIKGKKMVFFLRWIISSAIGGLLAAPMWLPALKAYSGGGRLNQTGLLQYSFNENMPFIQIFSKLFSGANSTSELVSGLPNIFCGILVLALVVLYFINKSIDIRKKKAAGIILGFYLLTFYLQALTLIMHGGTHTNWFPYRYSYVFSFLMICLAVEEFEYISELTFGEAKKCGVVLLIAALVVFSTSYEYITGGMVVLDFALLFLMWIGFWFYKSRPDKAPLRTLSLLLLILVCINLYANFIVSTRNVKAWELNLDEYNNNIMISGALVDALNTAEDGFYRMEKDDSESGSVGADPLLYNYNGVSRSGPGERDFIHKGLCKIGINWFDMRHWYSKGIPAATDSLLGLKYLVSKKDLTTEKGYEQKIGLSGYNIYMNPCALLVSILCDGNIQNIELGGNVFENLNAIWKGMTGEKIDIFTEQEDVIYSLFNDYSNQSITSNELKESFSKESICQTIDVSIANKGMAEVTPNRNAEEEETQTNSYIEYTFIAEKNGPVYVFDTSIPDSDHGLVEPAIRYVGTFQKGDIVEGKFPISAGIGSGDLMRGYCVNQIFAYADNELLAEYASKLNERDITFNVIHENDLTGTFTAEKGQRILFTMPWDEGWTCYIDGKEVPIDKTWDLFMSVSASEGEHTYEMKFFPAWINYGLIISGLAFIGLILLVIFLRKANKHYYMGSDATSTVEK